MSLIEAKPHSNFIVSNGDVLTDIDYTELLNFLSLHDAKAVMAVKLHEWTNPFGVVEMNGLDITGFSEKPVLRSHVNAGVYALSPETLKSAPGRILRHARCISNVGGRRRTYRSVSDV